MKTPATWLVRTRQLRNMWRPVAGGRKLEMLFAHLKRIPSSAQRLRLRGPNGAKGRISTLPPSPNT